jgi:uncharacterized lipoprotein YmbA
MTRPALLSRASSVLALCVLLLAGCAHTPKPAYYVLSAPANAAGEHMRAGPTLGLGPITLPEYLDRPQIVTRASDSRLVLSNEHRWAEPLAVSFARALHTALERALPGQNVVLHPWRDALTLQRQVRLDVTRFERDASGSFHLSARWSVRALDAEQSVDTRLLDIDIPVNGKQDDYDALVAAANGAVAALATAIASQLQAP